MSPDGAADGHPACHGQGDFAGPAGDPLPKKWQRGRRDRSHAVQPAGPKHLGRVPQRLPRLTAGVTPPKEEFLRVTAAVI